MFVLSQQIVSGMLRFPLYVGKKKEGGCQNLISSAAITAIARARPTTRAGSGIQVHFSISSLAFVRHFHESTGYSRLD